MLQVTLVTITQYVYTVYVWVFILISVSELHYKYLMLLCYSCATIWTILYPVCVTILH